MRYITIVNRHYPPNPGITGESAWDLAKFLIEKYNITPIIIHISRNYYGGGAFREPIGEIHTVKTIYEGENGLLKILAGFLDGFLLIIKTVIKRKGIVIVMTSPPLLPFWASWIFKIFKIKWYLWSMDLFPEGFVATNTISENNLFYRFFHKMTYFFAPQKLIALGNRQADYIKKLYKEEIETIFLPCGVLVHQEKNMVKPPWKNYDGKIYFGYCGNLGDAHSDEFIIQFIKHLNPEKHHLILAVYGNKAEKVIAFAKNKEGITLLKNVPRAELHYIDVHLVSLLKSWTHIAVPSKAISSVCSEGTILFCGSKESDSWDLLKQAGWYINIEESIEKQVYDFLNCITTQDVFDRKIQSPKIAKLLHDSLVGAYEKIALDASEG